jgi:short-subunit dehydrogenase
VAGSGAYLASKQAVLGISESLQQDLRAAGSSVRVSVLFPGAVKSRMYDAARHRHVRYGGPRAWDGGDSSEQAAGQAQRGYLESLGGDPDALADILLPQVDAGRFYVFARQGATDAAGEHAAGVRGGMLPLPRFTQTAGPGAHGG